MQKSPKSGVAEAPPSPDSSNLNAASLNLYWKLAIIIFTAIKLLVLLKLIDSFGQKMIDGTTSVVQKSHPIASPAACLEMMMTSEDLIHKYIHRHIKTRNTSSNDLKSCACC